MVPNKSTFALLGSRKIMEDISIKRKPAKINQKVPTSNIMPKRETCEVPEKRAESKNTKTTPSPPNKDADLGTTILPSKNLDIAQKITDRVNPTTKSSPLEISIGILEKGKKKIGNSIITKKSDIKESLLNMLVFMVFIILY